MSLWRAPQVLLTAPVWLLPLSTLLCLRRPAFFRLAFLLPVYCRQRAFLPQPA
jgi:hypothetical protein